MKQIFDEKGQIEKGIFQTLITVFFAYCIHYQKSYSFVVVCITRKLQQQNMSVKKIIKYRPKPSASHSLISLCPNILFFLQEKQVADKVVDKRTDGWASLDWREHVACSRAGVARYCAML